jgi:uncharacterized protein
MFSVITADQFTTSAWKNGGGVTHEIARKERDGKWLWRLSIAEVAADGPFSTFENLSRILTVIEGNGIDLHAPDAILKATLLKPTHFSGELPIEGKLIDGPIRDLNIIFDASFIDAGATAINGPSFVEVGNELCGYLSLAGDSFVDGTPIPTGAFALGTFTQLQTKHSATGILVSLKDRP